MVRWYDFSEKNLDKVPIRPGVYKIRWFRKGKPKAIMRLNGIDKEGIVYIGCAHAKILHCL